jgi:hypothetical protein
MPLPPAEDEEELMMDRKAIRFSVDLRQEDYALLCEVQHQRRQRGQRRVSLSGLVREAIYAAYPPRRD